METSAPLWHIAPHGTENQSCSALVFSISQLPTELLAELFRLALPPIEFMSDLVESQVLSFVRILYQLRLVAKRWQEIIDFTPTFWTFLLSNLPPHVKEATITRSNNSHLSLVYASTILKNGDNHLSASDFLDSLAHTHPRWSAYSGPLVSEYFDRPAPHLQTISLKRGEPRSKPLELLGGSATCLRRVNLNGISIQWKMGIFTQLKDLQLVNMSHPSLTITLLLDILQASPFIEHLQLDDTHATMDHQHPPSSPIITLHHLRSISFYHCYENFAGAILNQIRAPSCMEFRLEIFLEGGDLGLPQFLNEDLQPFHGLLRAMHACNGSSTLTLDVDGFIWDSPGEEDVKDRPTFYVLIFCQLSVPGIRWVENILQNDPGLTICFGPYAFILPDMSNSIAPMRCVTKVQIEDSMWGSEEKFLFVSEFIGKPLGTDRSMPSLPCLRELFLPGVKWTGQNILDIVRLRFGPLLWEGTRRTPLTISMSRGAFNSRGRPRPILHLSTLAKIRETDGVERVQFVGSEKFDGTLAIIWDEEASAPARSYKRTLGAD